VAILESPSAPFFDKTALIDGQFIRTRKLNPLSPYLPVYNRQTEKLCFI